MLKETTDGDTGSALKRESLEKEIDSCWWGGGVGVEPKPTAHGLGEGEGGETFNRN